MIRWVDEPTRFLAMCGDVAVGAVFRRNRASRYVSWRAWVTRNMNPVDGTAPTFDRAQQQVERRFAEFVALARLMPIAEKTSK